MNTCNAKRSSILRMTIALVLLLCTICSLLVSCDKGKSSTTVTTAPAPAGPEGGTYYYDSGVEEYTLTLSDGKQFTLTVKGKTAKGSYDLANSKLTLDFAEEGKANVIATYENNTVTLTYEGATMRFYKKINYTVSFVTNGANDVKAQTVLNGKTAAKPADPVRSNFVFIGWYLDSSFKTPFSFSQPVTGDITLYARWVEKVEGAVEYTVSFDANYGNAQNPADRPTVGGKLYGLPVIERAGYVFMGWWISMSESGDKLSYQYEEGTAIKGDITLYAMWQKIPAGDEISAPVVRIAANSISWNAVKGARSYKLIVTNQDGVAVIEQETPATAVNVSFAALDAGEYQIKVIAYANAGEEYNAETTLYYSNKQLDKVTRFTVAGSWLSFEGVANAEKYLISVVCGNPDHQHTALDNGTSTTFNFANCKMTKDGIRFTVTAVAEGYISSTSREYLHLLLLDGVEGLSYDEATQEVRWNAVPHAEYYMVSVKCGNPAHSHEFVNNGADTFVSLKYCDATDGGITVSVYPCAAGYASPEPAQVIANKNVIATPTGIRINGTVLTWDAVVGADRYEVQIGTALYQTNTNSLDISSAINWKEGVEYAISVRAIGKTSSVFSDPVKAYYNAFSAPPAYAKGELSWTPVIGATVYEIQVNGGEIVTVSANRTSAPVTLTRNGINTVRIRFSVASVYSDWTAVEVKAYTVTFDTLGGSHIPALYKAEGDTVTLPGDSQKAGYTFVAWYNVPGGPNANGMAYGDSLVIGAESVTVYAYYTPQKYTVTYNYGIYGTGDRQTDEVPFESHYQLMIPTPVNTTVAFGGWYTGPYGTGTQLTDSQGNSLAPWPVAEGDEVFAYWISEALTFVPTKIGGRDVYMVMAGPRIALLEEVTVPALYEGLPVAMIAGNAFANCTNLKVLNIPATLEQISIVDPFAGCSNLEAVNVYAVEGSAQGHLWSSDGVLFDNGTGDVAAAKLVFMPMGKTGEYTVPDGITVIPEGAFANSLLSKITIPASVTQIGNNAFDNCKNLTSVVFVASEGAEPLTIGNNAFNDCTALESITLPARLTSIALGKYSLYFEDKDGGINVEVVEKNAVHAFSGCTALTSIAVASGNKVYKAVDSVIYSADGTTLIYCPTNKSGVFNVPTGTQTVAAGAFVGCYGITEVVLPATLKLVGEAAFAGLDEGFEKITVTGNSFVSLMFDTYAFLACADLTELVLEPGSHLSELGEGAFYGCDKLASITIPASMTKIGKEAFRECGSLVSVVFEAGEGPLVFGERVFYACDQLASIRLPANVTEIPGIFLGCDALERVEVDPLNPYMTADVEGVLFSADMTELLYYPVAKSGDYTIPATVKKIAPSAFAYNENIGTLTVYTTLEVIGEHAFDSARIVKMVFSDHSELPAATSLIISDYAFASARFGTGTGTKTSDLILPDNTKSIGRYAFSKTYFNKFSWGSGIEVISPYAFYNNSYLGRYSSVAIPESITEIGEYTFYKCTYLGRTGGTVVLHDQLTRIGEYAFYGCSDTYFTFVEIPASVTEIGAYAFCNASKLATVTFAEGSQLVKIGAHAFDKTVIVEITIPASVSDIGAYAFANNNKMTTVIFAESENEATAPGLILGSEYVYEKTDAYGVSSIVVERGHVFGDDSTTNKLMQKVVLPARLVEIGEYTFFKAGVSGATVTLPANSRLQVIGAHAFDQSLFGGVLVLPATMQNMTPVTDSPVPYDRLAIGAYAFNRSKFTKITFAGGGTAPVTVGECAFTGCTALTEITLPASLSSYLSYTGEVIEALQGGAKIFGAEGTVSDACGKLSSIKVEASENALYAGIDGILYKTNGSVPTELVLCPVNNTAAVTIPATVTKIWDLAFYGCAGLPSVTFEGGVDDMVIGNKAFYGCSALTSVALPDNVVSLGAEAFAYCSALTELTLSANLRTFSGAMVDGCNALTNIYVGNGNQGVHYASIDGILYTADMTSLIFYPPKHNATSFTIPGTVTVIGASTFAGNTFLKEVILGEGVVEIRDSAFASSSITKITIPSTVSFIGDNAFDACRSLSEVVFAGEGTEPLVIGNRAFYLTVNLASVIFPARLVSIGNEAFAQTLIGGLSSVTFAENSQLLTVGDMAFSKTNLARVNLPAGMQSIGNKVFYECENLLSVNFGEGLVSIGDQTFGYCVKLEEVNFPATMRTMGVNTFFAGTGSNAACKNLKRVTFGTNSQLQSIPAGTFAYSGLTEIVIPASVKEITFFDHEKRSAGSSVTGSGDIALGAFDNCKSLVFVTFEHGSECVKIGAFAFYQCSGLANIEIAPSVSTVGTQAFYQCAGLTELTIPASCTNFGKQAIASCTGLTAVVMHSKATSLSESMFDGCSALKTINIPETVSFIGAYCFRNTAIAEITLPASVTDLSAVGIFYGCKSLVSVTIDSKASVLGDNMFCGCSKLANVKLSDSIEVLSPGVFENCTALSTITLPASVRTVASAFVDSGLAEYVVADGNAYFVSIDGVLFDIGKTKIIAYPANKTSPSFTIPKEVIEIGAYTFENITALREILFEQGGTAELRILDNAFYGCTGIGSIVFPERLTYIGKKAFYGCKNLVSVVLPSTLEEIGTEAFRNCKILEVGNFSGIALALGDTTKNGYVMYNAIYLYTALGGEMANGTVIPQGGKLLTVDENGIGTMRIGNELHFVAYVGTSSGIVVPEGVTHIGDELFYQNKNIVKVSLPGTLVWIGEKAFSNCSNLTEINLPDSITYIGGQAFYYCNAIVVKHNLPASLKTIGERAFYQSTVLHTNLVMPAGVTEVGYRAFGNNALTTFYITATEQPAGYDSAWAWKSGTENHVAIWGFSGEEITYTFTEQVGEGQEATVYHTVVSDMPISVPSAPTKDGFIFAKWVDADGNEVTGSYYSTAKTTLYAQWMTQEEYDQLNAGKTFDLAFKINPGETLPAVIDEAGEYVYFVFTATEDGNYSFKSIKGSGGNSTDTEGYMYNASKEKIAEDDDGAGSLQFSLTFDCVAGETYYFVAKMTGATTTCNFTVTLIKN